MINSLSTYAKINKYGFIESPYKRVKEGVVQDKVEYLSAMEETKFTIAQANTKIDKNGNVTGVRSRAPHPRLEKEAARVINMLPKMKPGRQRGKAVTVPYSLPITFQVQD